MKEREKITEDTVVADVLKRPGASEILSRYNLPCMHCPMAAYEMGSLKMGYVARKYGIDLERLLSELNKR